MNQNSNRGNAPRHPRSPLSKPAQANQGANQSRRPPAGNSAALFSKPPQQARNWMDDGKHAAPAPRAPAAPLDSTKNKLRSASPNEIDVSIDLNNKEINSNKSVIANIHRAMGVKAASESPNKSINDVAAQTNRAPATTDEGFAALGLRDELVRAVLAHGYSTPTPIQKQAIPAVLDGGDLLGGAQTGTGKTAGFVLPMLQRLMAKPSTMRGNTKLARTLILAPTRELAAQVEESVRVYGKFLPLTSTCIFGGVNINPQITAMKRGVDIVVATPGRLLDLHQQRAIDLSAVEILVLDEADRMLDMGFIHDIKKVLAVLPPKRQNLLFSATFSDDIKALTDRLLNNPRMIEVARRNTTIEVVDQSVVLVDKSSKAKLLIHLVKERQWFQVLVFTRTKHGANRLAEQLSKSGIPSLAIHGNKSQGARTKALAEFKSGTLQVLVATDIAARGIDIDQLPHVVNYELPNVPEDYVHRIGRTGRAGATGEAMSLVMNEELPLLKDIEKFTKQTIARVKIEGFDPSKIPDPVAPTSEARDAEWQARGGRPAPRGRSGGGGASAPPRSGAAAPRPAGGGQSRGNSRGGGRGR